MFSEQLGIAPSTVFKWCTNSSQPDVASLLKIADLLEVDRKELLIREYKKFLLSRIIDFLLLRTLNSQRLFTFAIENEKKWQQIRTHL